MLHLKPRLNKIMLNHFQKSLSKFLLLLFQEDDSDLRKACCVYLESTQHTKKISLILIKQCNLNEYFGNSFSSPRYYTIKELRRLHHLKIWKPRWTNSSSFTKEWMPIRNLFIHLTVIQLPYFELPTIHGFKRMNIFCAKNEAMPFHGSSFCLTLTLAWSNWSVTLCLWEFINLM